MKKRPYTKMEDALLKGFYPNKNVEYLIKILPSRSSDSIRIRANRLKIKKSKILQ